MLMKKYSSFYEFLKSGDEGAYYESTEEISINGRTHKESLLFYCHVAMGHCYVDTKSAQNTWMNILFNFELYDNPHTIIAHIYDFKKDWQCGKGAGSFCFKTMIHCIIDYATYCNLTAKNIEINGQLSTVDSHDWPETIEKYFHWAEKYGLKAFITQEDFDAPDGTRTYTSVSEFCEDNKEPKGGKLLMKGTIKDLIRNFSNE